MLSTGNQIGLKLELFLIFFLDYNLTERAVLLHGSLCMVVLGKAYLQVTESGYV